MSKSFIQEKFGMQYLAKARDQQKQIKYFIESNVQEDISIEYLQNWAEREYRTEVHFHNFLKTVLKTDNFLAVYKHLRYPVASAGLVRDMIVPAFERVFFSEDSYCNYTIRNKSVNMPEELKCKEFEKMIFQAIIYDYNNILIHDLEDVNKPYRELVDINNVVAIDCHGDEIERIAYSGKAEVNGVEMHGYLYMDEYEYAFYDKDLKDDTPLLRVPHDLGECPADFIVPDSFNKKEPVVRISLFSMLREKMEEFVFLKALQKLTDINGGFPITVNPKATIQAKDERILDQNDQTPFPMLSGQVPKTSNSLVQAGTHVQPPVPKKEDGSYDMDVIEKYFKFFYIPVEILEFIDKRIKSIETNILTMAIGRYSESAEGAKNELQVSEGYVNKEDRLRQISRIMSRIRTISDYKLLALQYGREAVTVDVFYGSDFFIETENDLYERFEKSPNVIERKNLLVKISSTRNRFSPTKSKREKILYDLLPFISDKDFDAATAKGLDDITFLYQTRFNYWISQFEANYGNIVEFWYSLEDVSDSEKLILIDNLVKNFIKDYAKTSSTPTSSEGGADV